MCYLYITCVSLTNVCLCVCKCVWLRSQWRFMMKLKFIQSLWEVSTSKIKINIRNESVLYELMFVFDANSCLLFVLKSYLSHDMIWVHNVKLYILMLIHRRLLSYGGALGLYTVSTLFKYLTRDYKLLIFFLSLFNPILT